MSRTHRKHVVSHGIRPKLEGRPYSRRGDHVFTDQERRTYPIYGPVMPPVVLVPNCIADITPDYTPDIILFDPSWVPSKKRVARQPREWYIRERRLDLIQTLGEEMLKTSFDF